MKRYWRVCLSFSVFLIFLILGKAFAATVTNVNGTIRDGETVVISGSNFGTAGPNVIVFDDFEGGRTGADIKTGTGSATVGKWTNRTGSSYYGNSASLSGNQSFTSNFSSSYLNYIQADFPSNTRNVYLSWWLFVPSGNNFPGQGTKDGDNWKQMWIQGSSTTDDDLVVPTRLSSWLINGNDRNPGYVNWTTVNMRKGEWKRLWVWLKGSTSSTSKDGEVKFWELTDTGVVQRENDTNANNLKATGAWARVRPNGYGRTTPNCITSFDDIYVAVGKNAQARIEIGNAPKYFNSTKLTVLTPKSWGNTRISALVHLGSFNTNETAYLYVVDGNGNVSDGYPVTIGTGGGDSVSPETPRGFNFNQ